MSRNGTATVAETMEKNVDSNALVLKQPVCWSIKLIMMLAP